MQPSLEHALHARFLRGLEAAPDRPACRVEEDWLSYRDAHELALSWAGEILAAGGPDTRAVGVLTGRSLTSYVGVLACLYAGVAAVPLITEFPVARTQQMLEAAGVSAVIVDDDGATQAEGLAGLGVPFLAPPEVACPGARVLDGKPGLAEPRGVIPADLAYVLFTSGSTGRPKGVRLTHGNLTHYFGLMDDWYDFTAADTFSQAANLNWDSAVSDLWCAWGAGAQLVSVGTHDYRDIPAFVRENGITVWFSAPSVVALVRRTRRLEPGVMPGLRWTFFGGEAFVYEDARDWQAAAPGCAVVNVYGPTEMTITTHRHQWHPGISPLLGVNGVVPLGVLHEGHEQLLLDDAGEPSGTEGELWLSGPQLCAGYLDPADGFGKYLDRDGRRWYRTGDRVAVAAGGELVYLGRVDSQVQVGGYRVELAEVDHAVRGLPGIAEAVTVGASVAGTTALMVFFVGDPAPPAVFARRLADVLPAQMIPKHYRGLDVLPLNTNKKIDRLALTELANRLIGSPAGV